MAIAANFQDGYSDPQRLIGVFENVQVCIFVVLLSDCFLFILWLSHVPTCIGVLCIYFDDLYFTI